MDKKNVHSRAYHTELSKQKKATRLQSQAHFVRFFDGFECLSNDENRIRVSASTRASIRLVCQMMKRSSSLVKLQQLLFKLVSRARM